MSLSAYIPGTSAYKKRRNTEICQQAHDRLQEIVDGEVTPARAKAILEQHLEDCPPCKADAGVIRDLKAAIARVSADADAGCVDKLNDLARRLSEGTHEAVAEE